MHGTVVFVGPCGVGKNAVDALFNLGTCLIFADDFSELRGYLGAALNQVLRYIEEDLRSRVCGCPGPFLGFMRGLYGIADVFAIAQRSFTDESSIGGVNREL